jgi:hypothetical protein
MIEFTPQELQIIMFGLGELPAKQSIDLIIKIRTHYDNSIKQDTKAIQK